jgi:hypothetical protein
MTRGVLHSDPPLLLLLLLLCAHWEQPQIRRGESIRLVQVDNKSMRENVKTIHRCGRRPHLAFRTCTGGRGEGDALNLRNVAL